MNAPARYTNALTPVPAGPLRSLRAAWRRLRLRPRPLLAHVPAARIAQLAAVVEREPALRMWVLALDGRTPAVQRALLARSREVFRGARSPVREVLAQMARREVREPVLAALTVSAPRFRATLPAAFTGLEQAA